VLSKVKSKYNGPIEATLSNFSPSSVVTVTFDSIGEVGHTTVDANGNGVAHFRTPLVAYGTYTVAAIDPSFISAETTLGVIPRIKLTAYTGPVGLVIRVYFYGFSSGEQVQVQWYKATTSFSVLKTIAIASNGRGTTLITIPNGALDLRRSDPDSSANGYGDNGGDRDRYRDSHAGGGN
jgi:hypothetical protein